MDRLNEVLNFSVHMLIVIIQRQYSQLVIRTHSYRIFHNILTSFPDVLSKTNIFHRAFNPTFSADENFSRSFVQAIEFDITEVIIWRTHTQKENCLNTPYELNQFLSRFQIVYSYEGYERRAIEFLLLIKFSLRQNLFTKFTLLLLYVCNIRVVVSLLATVSIIIIIILLISFF